MTSLDRDGDVWVLSLGSDENRFNPDWMTAVTMALDEVEAQPTPRALVTHAEGKIWSNGLDLDWLEGREGKEVDAFVEQVHALLARFLRASVFTVAAVQGHAFAAGAMLALAHDLRVMRADRGFLCLPEANIDVPFTPGMAALLRAKTPAAAVPSVVVGAARLGGPAAVEAGLVHLATSQEQVLAQAVELARPHAAKAATTVATIKQRIYAAELAALGDSAANTMQFPG